MAARTCKRAPCRNTTLDPSGLCYLHVGGRRSGRAPNVLPRLPAAALTAPGVARRVAGTHVTSPGNAAAIREHGFRLGGRGFYVEDPAHDLGRGVYVGVPDTDGEHRSERLYQTQYRMRRMEHETLHVEATVENPAVVDYDSFARKGRNPTDLAQVGPTKHKAVFQNIPGFAEAYDELHGPRVRAYHDFLQSGKIGTEDGPPYPDTDPSEVLQALGYDSVLFLTKQRKATVGGSQLVVFDPSMVRITTT